MRQMRNLLLATLPEAQRNALEERLEPVELTFRLKLFGANEEITHVYFPDTGVGSIVADQSGGRVEVATVGYEGMVGLPIFLGTESVPLTAFIQIPGAGRRMSAAAFRDVLGERANGMHDRLNRYTQALFFQIAQSAACRSAHSPELRCARWLLMTHDRVESDRFPLSQEFLSQMLGVQEAVVTKAENELNRRGLIEYSRTEIEVNDRTGLERASCECYRRINDEFERLLGTLPRPQRTLTDQYDPRNIAYEAMR